MKNRINIELWGFTPHWFDEIAKPWWATAELYLDDVSITISSHRCATPWECFDRVTTWAARILEQGTVKRGTANDFTQR